MVATKYISAKQQVKKRRRITKNRAIKPVECCHRYKSKCGKTILCIIVLVEVPVTSAIRNSTNFWGNSVYVSVFPTLIRSDVLSTEKFEGNKFNSGSYTSEDNKSKTTFSFSKKIHLNDAKVWKIGEKSKIYNLK